MTRNLDLLVKGLILENPKAHAKSTDSEEIEQDYARKCMHSVVSVFKLKLSYRSKAQITWHLIQVLLFPYKHMYKPEDPT